MVAEDPSIPDDLLELQEAFSSLGQAEAEFKKGQDNLMALVKTLSEEIDAKNRDLEAKVAEIAGLKAQSDEMVESISDGVIACDTQGTILIFNRCAQELTRCNTLPADIRAATSSIDDAFMPLFQMLSNTLEGSATPVRELPLVIDLDHSTLTFLVSINTVKNHEGIISGAVASFNDHTEIVRLQEDLKRRDRLQALGGMAAGVAHEIRNPLGGIALYADMIADDMRAAGLSTGAADKISTAVSGLNRLVEDMLSFTRSQKLMLATFKIEPLLRHCADMALARFADHTIELSYAIEIETVYADEDQLEQIILNIIQNACQAMEGSGQLELSCRPDPERNGMIEIGVADSGPGIDEELRAAIFDPFYTRGKKEGTGLGLAIALKCAESHKGTIDIRTAAQGGAEFIIRLAAENRA